MVKNLLLLVGPESTGTRWLSSLISQHNDITGPSGDHNDPLDEFWLSHSEEDFLKSVEVNSKYVLCRRSIPAGPKPGKSAIYNKFERLDILSNLCSKHNIQMQVLVTNRSIAPHLNSWTKNRASVEGSLLRSYFQYQLAYRFIFDWLLKSHLAFMMVSLESVIFEKEDCVQGIYKFLGLKPGKKLIIDANLKVNKQHYSADIKAPSDLPLTSHSFNKSIKVDKEKNAINVQLFDKQTQFFDAYNRKFAIDIVLKSDTDQDVSLTIQNVYLGKKHISKDLPIKLSYCWLNLFRTGDFNLYFSFSKVVLDARQIEIELTAVPDDKTQSISTCELEQIPEYIRNRYTQDKIQNKNIYLLINHNIGYLLINTFLSTAKFVQNIKNLWHVNEVREQLLSLKKNDYKSLLDIVYLDVSNIFEKIFDNGDEVTTSFDKTVLHEHCLNIFSNLRSNLLSYFHGEKTYDIYLDAIDDGLYKLTQTLRFFKIEELPITSEARALVYQAQFRNDLIIFDFLLEKRPFLYKDNNFSNIRTFITGIDMKEIKEHFAEMQTNLSSALAKSEYSAQENLKFIQTSLEVKLTESEKVAIELKEEQKQNFDLLNDCYATIETTLQDLKQTKDNQLIAQYKVDIATLNRKLSDSQAKLLVSSEEVTNLTQEASKLHEKIKQLTQHYTGEMTTLNNNIDALKNEKKNLIHELKETERKISFQEDDINSRYREIISLTQRCEHLSDVNIKNSKLLLDSKNENEKFKFQNDLLIKLNKVVRPSIGLNQRIKLRSLKRKLSVNEYNEYVTIYKSGIFDENFYLEMNNDVKSSKFYKNLPILHYIRFGCSEGREPNPFFSTDSYLFYNREVNDRGINPLVHCINEYSNESS